MSAAFNLEKQILALTKAEREHLAIVAWESLVGDPSVAGDPSVDREGIEIAATRDAELESGATPPISHSEFVRRTGGGNAE